MSKLSKTLALGALALTAFAGAAQAQTQAASVSSAASNTAIEIKEGVQISTLQKLTLTSGAMEALAPSASAMIDAITVIQVSGDPGRAYRIRLPHFVTTEGRALVEAMSARGSGGGDATEQNVSIATGGRDVIRLQGRLRVSSDTKGGSTAMPLSVDVE